MSVKDVVAFFFLCCVELFCEKYASKLLEYQIIVLSLHQDVICGQGIGVKMMLPLLSV